MQLLLMTSCVNYLELYIIRAIFRAHFIQARIGH